MINPPENNKIRISNYLVLALIAIVISGIKLMGKEDYRYALDREHNLYVEVINSGLAGNQRTEYLTDSANFRIYAGTTDNKSSYMVYRITG
jgi:hypothetical protein